MADISCIFPRGVKIRTLSHEPDQSADDGATRCRFRILRTNDALGMLPVVTLVAAAITTTAATLFAKMDKGN